MAQISIPVTILKKAMADRFANTSPTYGTPDEVQIGIGTQSPLAGATALTRSAPIDGYEIVDDCDATTGWSASTDGSVSLNTTAGQYIEGTGAINLIKSGTTQTVVTYSKTVTSRDFTSKDLWAWVYIDDLTALATSACLKVRFGSDSSNYYERSYDKADLAAGANWTYFSTTTADSTTGSPTIGSCDYMAFVFTWSSTSGTAAAGDIRIDHLQLADTTVYQRAFEATYPTVSADGTTVRMLARIRSNMAIGQQVTNFAWFLSDGSMYGLDQIDVDTKTQEEEWQLTDEVQVVDRV